MKPKIAIATPHQADFRDAVIDQMHKEIQTAKTWLIGTYHKIENGSCISSLRWNLAKSFLKGKDDFLLFMDSDMFIIREGSIDELLATSKRYSHKAIVSALFGKKTPPYKPTYTPVLESDKEQIIQKGTLEKESTGMAFTLIPREVLQAVFGFCKSVNDEMKDIPELYRRFEQPFQPFIYNDHYTGEDRAFCIRASYIGIKTVIETSVVIGHIGDCVFTPDSWLNSKEGV